MEGYLASILSSIPQNAPVDIEVLPPTPTETTNTNTSSIDNNIVNWLQQNWMIVAGIVVAGALVGYFIARK